MRCGLFSSGDVQQQQQRQQKANYQAANLLRPRPHWLPWWSPAINSEERPLFESRTECRSRYQARTPALVVLYWSTFFLNTATFFSALFLIPGAFCLCLLPRKSAVLVLCTYSRLYPSLLQQQLSHNLEDAHFNILLRLGWNRNLDFQSAEFTVYSSWNWILGMAPNYKYTI